MRFKGKVVVVTGGGKVSFILNNHGLLLKGIGMHISRRFAAEGAHVVIAEISRDAGISNEKFIKDQSHSAYFVETDVSQEISVKSMVDQVTNRFGAIHCLINNAGIGSFGNIFAENSVQNFDKVLHQRIKIDW